MIRQNERGSKMGQLNPMFDNPVNRASQPTTTRQARARRLEENGIDAARLRETFARQRDSEQGLKDRARRAAILRTQGRRAEAEQLVSGIRAERDDPNRGARLREAGRIRGLLNGGVGDLPQEQQVENAAANLNSMDRSVQQMANAAASDAGVARVRIMRRQAELGKQAMRLEYGEDRAPTDEQAASFFQALPANEQARFTRGVPIGTTDATNARAVQAADVAANFNQTIETRAPRAFDEGVLERVRRRQALEIGTENLAQDAATTGLEVAGNENEISRLSADAARRAAIVRAGRVGDVTNAGIDAEQSGFAAQKAANDLAIAQAGAEGTLVPQATLTKDADLRARQAESEAVINNLGGLESAKSVADATGFETPEQLADNLIVVGDTLLSLRQPDGILGRNSLTAEKERDLVSTSQRIEANLTNMSPSQARAYARALLTKLSARSDNESIDSAMFTATLGQEARAGSLNMLARSNAFGGTARERVQRANKTYKTMIQSLQRAAEGQ